MENNEIQVFAPEIQVQLERAAIDVQIATAHQFPRSMQAFLNRATALATIDSEVAESCIYRRPVGKDGNKVIYAEGKSVRFAEIVASTYGNIRVAAQIVEQTPKFVKVRGMAHDLESNFASACEIIEPTVYKDGTPYKESQRILIAKAALAKARRDATFQVIPGALCKPIENAVKELLVGKGQPFEIRVAKVEAWVKTLKVSAKRVWESLGIKGPKDLTIDLITDLIGIKTAIDSGEISQEDAFPIGGKADAPAGMNPDDILDKIEACKTTEELVKLHASLPAGIHSEKWYQEASDTKEFNLQNAGQ